MERLECERGGVDVLVLSKIQFHLFVLIVIVITPLLRCPLSITLDLLPRPPGLGISLLGVANI